MTLLSLMDSGLREGALEIVRVLREHHQETYFAGGVVRDLILNRPVSDVDIATAATPDQIQSLFPHTIPVGREFGVIIVVLKEVPYEVATFRSESGYSDGRHPDQVSFASAREDARRRDFTVNALFLDPLQEKIIDFVEGRRDLEARLIRTVGDPADRFREDKLRLMRAIRFACQLKFDIEAPTWEEIKAHSSEIKQVSWERIRDELLKILTGPQPARGLSLLKESEILQEILPEVTAMDGVPQPPEFHPEGDVFEHTRLMFELSDGLSEALALGVLLHDVGKPPTYAVKERIRFDGHAEVGATMAGEICRRLKLSRELTDQVVDLVAHHLRFIPVQEMRESTLKRFLRKENFSDHLELHRLDCASSHRDLTNYYFCLQKLREFQQEAMRPDPLISGHDLIDLGLKPGPIFSEILDAVEDRQLEGELETRDQALEWVRQYLVTRSE